MIRLLGGIGRGRPLASDGVDRLHCVPAVRGDHRDAILDFQDLLDPRHRSRLAGVVRLQGLALARVQLDGGIQHAVHLQVDAELQLAHDLRANVEAHHRLAQHAPFRRIARLGIEHRRNLCGVHGEIDVGDLGAVGQDYMARLGAQVGHGETRTLGSGSLQRLARDRAGNAQLFIGVRHRARPAGHLQARLSEPFERLGARFLSGGTLVRSHERRELVGKTGVEIGGAGAGEANFELAGIEVHLFGDHDRLHRADTLADIGVLGDQRDFVGADLDPGIEGHGVRRKARGQWIVTGRRGLRCVAVGAESDAAGNRGGAEDESPAGKLLKSHVTSPPSLRLPHGSRCGCAGRYRNGTNCRTSPR
ncbi:hypothetical protein ACQ5SK_09380 [Bradyrhizobium japonicum]